MRGHCADFGRRYGKRTRGALRRIDADTGHPFKTSKHALTRFLYRARVRIDRPTFPSIIVFCESKRIMHCSVGFSVSFSRFFTEITPCPEAIHSFPCLDLALVDYRSFPIRYQPSKGRLFPVLVAVSAWPLTPGSGNSSSYWLE